MSVEKLIAEFGSRRPLRSGSLIITLFADAIAPHGGSAWLGSLIALLEPFGLNARLVRTTVYRLAQDDWLASRHVGRRSYYGLTQTGRQRLDDACRRIYVLPQQEWDGQWCLLITGVPEITSAEREAVRRELTSEGFGVLAPGVLAHPGRAPSEVVAVLQALDVRGKVAVLTARSEQDLSGQSLQSLVRSCWNLEKLSHRYQAFLERFRPIWSALQVDEELDPQRCFIVRTLLVHEYRQILRHDPQLPDVLLPADWAGAAARLLCRNLYRLVQAEAEQHLMSVLETAEGPVPEAAPSYYQRFGGL